VRGPLIKKTKQTREELEDGRRRRRAELYDGERMAEKGGGIETEEGGGWKEVRLRWKEEEMEGDRMRDLPAWLSSKRAERAPCLDGEWAGWGQPDRPRQSSRAGTGRDEWPPLQTQRASRLSLHCLPCCAAPTVKMGNGWYGQYTAPFAQRAVRRYLSLAWSLASSPCRS